MSGQIYAGHTKLSSNALATVARQLAASLLSVPGPAVRVQLGDTAGLLSLTLATPVMLGDESEQLIDRLRCARSELARQFTEHTGLSVGRVDIRVTGIEIAPA